MCYPTSLSSGQPRRWMLILSHLISCSAFWQFWHCDMIIGSCREERTKWILMFVWEEDIADGERGRASQYWGSLLAELSTLWDSMPDFHSLISCPGLGFWLLILYKLYSTPSLNVWRGQHSASGQGCMQAWPKPQSSMRMRWFNLCNRVLIEMDWFINF